MGKRSQPSSGNNVGAVPKQGEGIPQPAAVETKAAAGRIRKAISDSVTNIAAEKAGTKAPHVPPKWARKR